MRKRIVLIIMSGLMSMLLLLSFCVAAYADEEQDVTEVNAEAGLPVREQPAGAGFHGILGAGLFAHERIIGDAGYRALPFPFIFVTYSDWAYWSFAGGGVWLLQSQDHTMKFGVGVKPHSGWSHEDDPILANMSDRRYSIDGSINAQWRTPVVSIGVNYYHDILNVSNGQAVTLRMQRNFWINQKTRVTPSIVVEWENAKLVNYYYGVRSGEATPSRPAYVGRDAVNVGAGLMASYQLSRSWSLLGMVYAKRLGNGITNSPIVSRDYSAFAGFGACWNF